MEIDCPEQAVAVWMKGETLHIRFPDRQEIKLPIDEVGRLITVLRARDHQANTRRDFRIATEAAPVQLDIYDEAKLIARRQMNEEKKAEKLLQERNARLRRAQKRQDALDAEKLLASAGL